MKKTKRIISLIMVLIITLMSMQGIVFATDITSAKIEDLGDCGHHLQYDKNGTWSYITTTMAGYRDSKGTLHYAYCMDVTKHGVGEEDSYTVSVSQMLSNPYVYTAIINGFPYKSASQLGVENDYDAFALTKQAVYCILYNRDVRSYYKGGDDRGVKMVNAMEKIVNTARNNPQTPNTSTNITVSKVGNWTKETMGKYYSQTYSVSNKVYEVSISNFPAGTIVTDVNGEKRTQFTNGEKFKVLVPTDKITKNITGTINVSGNIENYPIFYGESPNSNWQDYALTYGAFSTGSGKTTLNIDAFKSTIKVHKTDQDTKANLSDVVFTAKYKDTGEVIGTATTDKNGIATFTKIRQGEIVLQEKSTQKYYILNTEEKIAKVGYDDETLIEFTNEADKPSTDIEKTGILQTTANEEIRYQFTIKNTGNVPLSKFTWYDYIPTDYVKATKLVTGTYNQNLNYGIYYKTNLNDYKLLVDGLNSQTNNYVDFTGVKLEDGEYITEFKAEFGTVDVGFTSVESPCLFVNVKSDVKNDDEFTNKTRIEGYDKDILVYDEDEHTTTVYEKQVDLFKDHKVKLPRTGE